MTSDNSKRRTPDAVLTLGPCSKVETTYTNEPLERTVWQLRLPLRPSSQRQHVELLILFKGRKRLVRMNRLATPPDAVLSTMVLVQVTTIRMNLLSTSETCRCQCFVLRVRYMFLVLTYKVRLQNRTAERFRPRTRVKLTLSPGVSRKSGDVDDLAIHRLQTLSLYALACTQTSYAYIQNDDITKRSNVFTSHSFINQGLVENLRWTMVHLLVLDRCAIVL